MCVFICGSTYVEPTTWHSSAPELLRAAKPHLPFSISNRLPRAVCYIIKNGSSETRLRVFAARTLRAVTLCHCFDNTPRISNCSFERLVMPGDFVVQLHVFVAKTFGLQSQVSLYQLGKYRVKTPRELVLF